MNFRYNLKIEFKENALKNAGESYLKKHPKQSLFHSKQEAIKEMLKKDQLTATDALKIIANDKKPGSSMMRLLLAQTTKEFQSEWREKTRPKASIYSMYQAADLRTHPYRKLQQWAQRQLKDTQQEEQTRATSSSF